MNPFVAEIRIVGFNFPPRGWAYCDGQIMPISQNTALFSLLGTTYGGDGKSNFALPDLRDNTPLQQGQGPGLSFYSLGESGGTPQVTLLLSEMAQHPHSAMGNASDGGVQSPSNATWAANGVGRTPAPYYANVYTGLVAMNGQVLTPAGGSQPHNNRSPYLGLNFVIALQGVFPPRS
jgi:microcystin-dependent protein